MRGKLIVIDGSDGSGKATQIAVLSRRLRQSGYKVEVEDFPRYGKKSAGPVEEYLNGLYGSAKKLGPYIPSIFYAVDRFAASERIKASLHKGSVVLANRYVSANMGHQGGKIQSPKKRNEYFRWVYDLEYRLFKLPKPDLTLILHLPAFAAQKLIDRKGHREYVGGQKRDLHEKDISHLKAAGRTYLEIGKKFHYPIINCYEHGRILSRKEVAELIWTKVKRFL
ncbi:MAG: thymidylate kinase [Candidatus Doudnabacteria bacterium]|nr:thymidylate kinase [Candidatus Doudnabacteria bacterium]